MTTDQCICHQNSTFLGEKPPNTSEISHLSKTTFADIADMGREGKIGIKYDTKVPNCIKWFQKISQNIDRKEGIYVYAMGMGNKNYELNHW